ncbi:hypothetical protein [Paenibacillus tyrfis]|uniref:Uncharacterized protein n=1 Tax=Paenibacillus tyrfis TaxID=1501230 RepID=A0A081P4X7_9BACL|nr:hypothetical protein [Paenibacillus tyrfis]KEQ25750.1 hypothetical protein ET33_03305 [Paenibacillus tyrfis]
MNTWKRVVSTALIVSLALSFQGAVRAENPQPAIDVRYPAVLSGPVQVKVKSLLSERANGGARIAVVVKMYNVWGSAARVPDYELRVVTSAGTSYVLKPSADNPSSVPASSSVELSYMAQIDRTDAVQPTDLVWVDVNKDVYPKVETSMLKLPVSSLVWYGDAADNGSIPVKAWGTPFTIPGIESSLEYTPVGMTKQFKDGAPVELLQLLVTNTGTQTETVPAFTVDGKAAGQIYKGSRQEQAAVSVDPKEKKYLYISIPYEADKPLESLTVQTPESYKIPNRTDAAAAVSYSVGRLRIALPETQPGSPSGLPTVEGFGTRLAFDPLNSAVHPDLAVSVVDFRLYENKGQSYQTGVMKLKLDNRSDKPLPVPQLAAELIGASGSSYTGSQQKTAAQEVLPGTAYVMNYTFMLPLAGDGDHFTLKFSDSKTAAPYKTAIGQVGLNVNQTKNDDATFSFYPYGLNVKDWSLTYTTGTNPTTKSYTYTYKLKWNVDLKTTEPVIVDAGYSKLQLVIEGSDTREVARQTLSLTGEGRVENGEQSIYFTDTPSDQFDHPLTLRVYETVDTPYGPARRLIGTMQQP